jgi:tRNA(fMet)-specific endonuclease VapC
MKLAVDTNRYTDLARGDATTLTIVAAADELFLPFIVLAELRAGFVSGTRARENEKWLRAFRSRSDVAVLYPDEATTFQFALVFAQLRKQGTPIPEHDIWIAALALQHGLVLCTRDHHFDHLPQLMRA